MYYQKFDKDKEYKKVKETAVNFLTYMGYNKKKSKEKKEERVISLVKGEFERMHGMTFLECLEIYNDIVKNTPEKLI